MASHSPSPLRARLAVVGTALLFSTGGAAIKACALTAWQVAGLRSIVAAAVIAMAFPRARKRPTPATLAVGLGYATTLVTFVWANKLTTAALAIFLQYTAPGYMLVLAPLLLKEPVGRSDVLRTGGALGGMLLLFAGTPGASATAPDPTRGNLIAVVSGLAFAFTLVGLRWKGRQTEGDGSLDVVMWGNVIAFICCLPNMPTLSMTVTDALVIGYLGVFQIGLAYVLLTYGMQHLPALEATLLLLLEPTLSPAWTWWLQGERMTLVSAVGGAVVILSSVATRKADR